MSNIIEENGKRKWMTFPVCNTCKNYITKRTCKAFTEIPEEILNGESKHDTVLPEQTNMIIYQPIERE